MSRIPQPSSSRSGIKPPSTPVKSRLAPPSESARPRTISTRATTPSKPKATPAAAPPPSPGNAMSIKEAIALKRAEAKKALAKSGGGGGLDDFSSMQDALPTPAKQDEEEDLLGRLSVRDTIEQARSTGSLNLATRDLPCLPSALFEIHLGLTPDPLKSVPNEPALPVSEPKPSRRGGHDKPAWFEAQDLTVLKAWNNDIQEVQHEISLFGSLKTVDFHKNKLTSLPTTFADLTSLTVLDLSHNALSSLPEKLFALPELTTLNISNNLLTTLPFNLPFSNGRKPSQQSGGSFFTPTVSHANTPLPRLLVLDASNNKIRASNIDKEIPVSLTKINLSGNPLGLSQELLRSLSSLKRLKEVKFEKCEISDDSFPPILFTSPFFPALELLDLSDTQVNLDPIKEAFKNLRQELNHDFSTESPPPGVARILVGKQVLKEPWELELERRTNMRKAAANTTLVEDWTEPMPAARPTSRTSPSVPSSVPAAKPQPVKPREVVKEAWEIEAEQGLLTEGGRRRARAAAAAAAAAEAEAQSKDELVDPSERSKANTPTSPSSALTNPQYYTRNTQTLKLPPSAPPTKAASHARAFSMAAPSSVPVSSSMNPGDISIPTPTLPLHTIVNQPFADSLRVLILTNRRMDRSFELPDGAHSISGFLPKLEELDLEGCNLGDLVSVVRPSPAGTGAGASTPPRTNELLIPTLARLFPSLRTLNLSYNALTSAALDADALAALVLASPTRQGLRHLRLRGNRLADVDGFVRIAEGFKGGRNVPECRLEELDIRDNEIGKLPPELGLLPLEVFLVDGNTFRVPQRRVWEREGTKGLLNWLRGRVEE